jgi:phytoene dehydrogenase-like protein
MARHSPRDADAYPRYAQMILRQCRFIRPFLLRDAPDPASLRPRDLGEMAYMVKQAHGLGRRELAETLRFWTMSIGDLLDEHFESDLIKAHLAGSGIIGTGLGVYSPGTAYVLLHHYMGDIDGGIGAWGFARGGMGAISNALGAAFEAAGGTIHVGAGVAQILVKEGRVTGVALEDGTEFHAPVVASNMDVKRTFLNHIDRAALPEDFTRAVEPPRPRMPAFCAAICMCPKAYGSWSAPMTTGRPGAGRHAPISTC